MRVLRHVVLWVPLWFNEIRFLSERMYEARCNQRPSVLKDN